MKTIAKIRAYILRSSAAALLKANRACALLFLGAAALIVSGVGAERSAAQSTFGWDYNLMHECVNSVGTPGSQYYYADHSDCPVTGQQWIALNGVSANVQPPGAYSAVPKIRRNCRIT
jgi:hypothetical protein